MQESTSPAPAEGVAAYIGIDWADQKHDVVLRSASEPAKVEHSRIVHEPDALMEWLGELQQRFAGKGKVLVALEQSRGALIYHLMGYEFVELYPINPNQLANYRETFSPSGAKDDRPDAELICELLFYHGDRLKAWKPDDELTRKLAFFNEGRRKAVDQRTQLANEIKSQLKVYFPLALQVLDNNSSTALAADLLLQTVIADAGHQSCKLTRLIKAEGYELRIVKRRKRAFEVVGLTWIVERTFAWTVPPHEQGLRAPCADF